MKWRLASAGQWQWRNINNGVMAAIWHNGMAWRGNGEKHRRRMAKASRGNGVAAGEMA